MAILPTFPSNTVQLVVADLPYGEVNQKSAGLRLLDRETADDCKIDLDAMVSQLVRVCSGSFYLFCGTQQISGLIASFKSHGLTTRLGAWEKSNPSPMNGTRLWVSGMEFCVFARKPNATFTEHCQKALWKHPVGRSKVHPTEKPVALMERLIMASSAPGDTVLDHTMGSGTTGIAATKTGRGFIGIELNPTYHKMAIDRFQASASDESRIARSIDPDQIQPVANPVTSWVAQTRQQRHAWRR